jgi:hypothetical protein
MQVQCCQQIQSDPRNNTESDTINYDNSNEWQKLVLKFFQERLFSHCSFDILPFIYFSLYKQITLNKYSFFYWSSWQKLVPDATRGQVHNI